MDNNTLSVKEKIGYGMGDAGCNIIFGAIMLFVNYFYTDIFGLAPALVGVLLLSVRVIDAVTDPIMGAIADRTRSKYGRFRPWLLWIAFPYALFSVLMFTTPEWTYNSKVIYAFVTYFLLSITYTAINIPYCSLGTVMTADPKERVACQSYRFVMVGIATLLLSLTLLPMADWFGGLGVVQEPLPQLTPREREVLGLIARGRDNPVIASLLGVSEKTVRNVVSNIFAKLHVVDRASAAAKAREAGL